MKKKYDAVIVGAGMAGLVAARHLEEYNLNVLVIEQADRVGGRIKTDEHDGFRLDRGFQVLLTEYPLAKKYLDYEKLDLQYFEPGALSFDLKKKIVVTDVNRNKAALLRMAFSSIGSVSDKLKLARLRKRLTSKSVEEIFDGPNISTATYLNNMGFSPKIIKRFFQPFFAGIFLENDLNTSARMFEFTFKMFAEGHAAIPAKGMEEIPRQLKGQLKKTEFRFNTSVQKVEPGKIHLPDGELLETSQIIIATTPGSVMPQVSEYQAWNSTSQFYFSTENGIINKPLIGLQFREDGLVNNVVEMSSVSNMYAPKGSHLIQVSLRKNPRESVEEVAQRIKDELAITFGPEVEHWRFLQSYYISKALPNVEDPINAKTFELTKINDGIYIAGDQLLNPSLNAAMLSGELAAKALILNYDNSEKVNYTDTNAN